ncbi:hypothetical protein MCCG_0722 [Mycoplasma capricolum subsp. capripneumoniae 87001]|uniref:Uncharacterized protein n=1 Tax=Mycoplasma capricolum subsp. capripneumoniae 87001 TaxID=1124992 RepID=A0A9N7G8L7_MYCCC|nr:hypothetical protein MCCG_0722 [Mycoplasma capricolum subsp. capripneumoniae 87001]
MILHIKLLFLIIFLIFIFFEYSYFFDNFLGNAIKNCEKIDDIWYEILDKFRYFLGSLIATPIVILFNSTVHKEVKGIRNYLKNRNKYISVEYSKTIDLLKEPLVEIKKNNIENIDKICLSYDELVFKPIFVSRLIEDIQLDLITEEKNIISYSDVATNVLNLLEKMYENEKLKIKNSGKFEELSSGIIMGFRYSSTLSPYYSNYCWSIKNESNTIPIVYKYNTKILHWFRRAIYYYFFFFIIASLIKFYIGVPNSSKTFNTSSHNYIETLFVTIFFLFLLIIIFIIVKKVTRADLSFKSYLRKSESENYRKNKKNRFFSLGWNFLLFSPSILLPLMTILSAVLYFSNANWMLKEYTPPFLSLVLFYFTFLCLLLNGLTALKEIYRYKKYSKKFSDEFVVLNSFFQFYFVLVFLLHNYVFLYF